jgi:hypothetical protein
VTFHASKPPPGLYRQNSHNITYNRTQSDKEALGVLPASKKFHDDHRMLLPTMMIMMMMIMMMMGRSIFSVVGGERLAIHMAARNPKPCIS